MGANPIVVAESDMEVERWSDAVRGDVGFRTLFDDYATTTESPTVAGVDHRMEPGAAVFIPADAEHGVRNTGPERLRFVLAFALDSLDDTAYRFSNSVE